MDPFPKVGVCLFYRRAPAALDMWPAATKIFRGSLVALSFLKNQRCANVFVVEYIRMILTIRIQKPLVSMIHHNIICIDQAQV